MAMNKNIEERVAESTRLKATLTSSHRHLGARARVLAGNWVAGALLRLLELSISLFVSLLLALPLLLLLLIVRVVTGRKVFREQLIIGYGGFPQTIRYFNVGWYPASCTALYFQVLTGKLSLIGAKMRAVSESHPSPKHGYLNTIKPGIISLWQVRKNSNTGHEGFLATEWEYCFSRDALSDILILLRAIPTHFLGNTTQPAESNLNLLGVRFSNLSMREAMAVVQGVAINTKASTSFFFVNPDCLNKSVTDPAYKEVLQRADHVFPDGIGLAIACRILGSPLKENINGTDMLPFLCEMAVQNGLSLFLLGARPGVADDVKVRLQERYGVAVAGTHHGYFDKRLESEEVVEAINRSGADIVLVAFGAPLQEKWISANRSSLSAAVVMGVGGLFDFYSGNIRRAPRWLRELGLEWLYRLLQEPGRMWRRYIIGNPLFVFRVLLWKAKGAGSNTRDKRQAK